MKKGKIILEADFDGLEEKEMDELPRAYPWNTKLLDMIPNMYLGTIKVTIEYFPEREEDEDEVDN